MFRMILSISLMMIVFHCATPSVSAKGSSEININESRDSSSDSHTNHLNGQGEPSDRWTMPSTTVIIDVGHGGIDGGAHHGDLLEKDINLAIARKLYVLLRSQGIPAVMNRTEDYALSDDNRWHRTSSRHRRDLSQRKGLTEEIGSELLVSLHVNWARNRVKRGPLVLHQSTGESALLAFCLQDALNRQQQSEEMPREGRPFYLLRGVEQPSVIVEMGFISNEDDRTMLTDPRRQLEIAQAIASGIRQYKWVAN